MYGTAIPGRHVRLHSSLTVWAGDSLQSLEKKENMIPHGSIGRQKDITAVSRRKVWTAMLCVSCGTTRKILMYWITDLQMSRAEMYLVQLTIRCLEDFLLLALRDGAVRMIVSIRTWQEHLRRTYRRNSFSITWFINGRIIRKVSPRSETMKKRSLWKIKRAIR